MKSGIQRSARLWRVVQGVLALHAVLAIVAWFNLPTRIPTHFGASGNADSWGSASIVFWFGIVATSIGLSVMIHFLSLPAAKDVWNIGEKDRFLQLAPEQQAPVFELVRLFGAISALCINWVVLALHLGIYLVAHGHANGLPWYVKIVIFAAPACLLLALIPWDRAVRRTVLQASEGGKRTS